MLVVKMVEDNVSIVIIKTNYELLYDVETLLGLACILPLLELVQGLFKFAYMCDSFICDFMLLGFVKYTYISYIMILKKGILLHTLILSLILLSTSMTNCAYASGRNLPPILNTFLFLGR
jgi:hypothetical protein